MANFENNFNNFLWLGLMVFCMIAFIVSVQSDNNAPQSLIDEPLVNQTYSFLRQNITNNENTSKEQYGIYNDEIPEPTLGSIVLFTIVGVTKTFGNVIISTFLIIIKLPLLVLGIDPTIISTLLTWLSISIILGLWAIIKFGG